MQKQDSAPNFEIDQNQLKNRLINLATAKAVARLARFSSTEESKISQTFLFASNRFCGIRLDAGHFQASWQFENSTIQIMRGRQIVDQIAFQDEISKAA